MMVAVPAHEPHDDVCAALEWMVGDVADLDAHTLETFLWYWLPTKWMIDAEDRRRLCAGLAQALQAADRPRLAERCSDPQTAAAFDSWDAGMAALLHGCRGVVQVRPDTQLTRPSSSRGRAQHGGRRQ